MPVTHINWNQMSELGLIERINREILHPLGLAISRNPKTGSSDHILIAGDGVWQYPEDMENGVLSDDKVRELLSEIQLKAR